ncbi:GAF domain-containing protein, partial [candidate division KSB1 bacterium]
EKKKLIIELKEALEKIKTLKELIPICSSCKKIRNDEGFYEQVEEYISKHTESKFSHGICPDCMKELYPEYYESVIARRKNNNS